MIDDYLKDKLKNLEPPKPHDFESDTFDEAKAKGDVNITITLEWNYDPEIARAEIEKLTTDIGYANYKWMAQSLYCWTDSDTCKDVFNWDVVKDKKKSQGVKYTAEGYRQLDVAEVPESLDGIVKSVYLNRLNPNVRT